VAGIRQINSIEWQNDWAAQSAG